MIADAKYSALLRESALFAGYSDEQIGQVLKFSKRISAERDAMLFRANEPCSAFYFVVSGMVKLYCRNDRNQEKIIEIVEPGQTFAEAALFSGQGYPVNARAMEDSELIAIEGFAFTRFLHQHPQLIWNMLSNLSRRLHQLVKQVETLALHNAEQRVAAYLLEFSDVEAPQCLVRHLPPRRAELAGMLTSLRKRDLIQTEDSRIEVLDLPGLQRLLRPGDAAEDEASRPRRASGN
jgi:CRP-like cAMP-binding protein